jgi:hypothetical protein
LPADLIVNATGYGSMNGWAADLIGQEAADKVGKVWGLGSDTPRDPGPWEGGQRKMRMPTQQEALWFHGGNLHQSRHYSLYLALQLKARMGERSNPGLRLTGDASHIVMGDAKPARVSATGRVAKLVSEVRRSRPYQWQG